MFAKALFYCTFLSALVTQQAVAQTVTVTLVPISANEGASGPLCVFLADGDTAGRTFTLSFSTSPNQGQNAATEFVDYTPVTGTLVISDATNMFECFSVPLVDDNIPESEECFNTMIAPDGVQPDLIIIQSQSEICIIDNDDVVSVATVNTVVAQQDVASGFIQVCVQATDVTVPFEVGYFTQNVDAMAGVDYIMVTGTFSFDVTMTLGCVQITIIDDGMNENTENFELRLQNVDPPNVAVIAQDVTVISILDDDDISPSTRVFGFERQQYSVDENVSPIPGFQICVVLRQGQVVVGEMIELEISLMGDSATAGVDFEQFVSGTFGLEFRNNNQDQAQCAPIDIIDDLLVDGDKIFHAMVQVTDGSNIAIVPQITTITIVDDEEEEEEEEDDDDSFGPGLGDDPHFAIFLPSGKLLCYTVQGEHSFAFNLISNDKMHMNALFVPDSLREEVTWIGSLGIVIQNSYFQGSNTTRIRFESKINEIHINDKVILDAKNIEAITFHNGKLLISEGPVIETFHYPSVRVNLNDLGMSFTVNFTGQHLDMMWNKLKETEDSHGLIGQFFRKGVEIDAAQKLLYLPRKDPVPVMRKPVWAYMEHNVPNDQLCWVAMNPGYQGSHLIDGHYLDYVVDNVLSTDFKFECKHKK